MATTSTTVLDAMNYLQTLNRTLIPAPPVERYPTVIDKVPIAITWPGGGEWWMKGGGYADTTRVFRVLVYVQALGQDDIPIRAAQGATLLGQFLNLYLNAANVAPANPPPYQLTIESAPNGTHHSDDGLVPSLSFGGRNFVGFELSVHVRALWIPA